MIDQIRTSLAARHDSRLVDELLAAYQEAKTAFYQGGHRLQAVEGGRFCEAAFRLLEEETQGVGVFTPLNQPIKTDAIIERLARLPRSQNNDSIRLHIPRSLRVVYDIRNRRNTAHLTGDVDPNIQDATLVISTLDWVLAEFIRLWHLVTPEAAQTIVDSLVTRRAPIIEDFDGYLKVLNPQLTPGQHVLVLLYQCGPMGATIEQLREWARPSMRQNLNRTFHRLEHEQNYIHRANGRARITQRGIQYVDTARILTPS